MEYYHKYPKIVKGKVLLMGVAFFVSSSFLCTSWGVEEAGLMDAAPVAGENNHISGLAEFAQDRIFKDVFLILG